MKRSTWSDYIKNILATVSGLFLNGLIAILPLTLTIVVFNIAFHLIKSWVQPVHTIMPTFLTRIPHSEIILVFIIIIVLGLILRVFILQTLVHALEAWIIKLPLVRQLYSGLKQLVHAFNPKDTHSFKSVVLIEFPRRGNYSIGFVTSEMPHQLSPDSTKTFLSVFVPTTPNPTTGFFLFVPKEEIMVINLTRQEAMALIISGGIIQPDRFKK